MNRSGPERTSAVFPGLDADLVQVHREQPGTTKRVCIATVEIAGVAGSAEVGRSCRHLARRLAAWGHEVVVAHVSGKAAGAGPMEESRALYAGLGVSFECLVSRAADPAAPTWALYEWLRARGQPFDMVHVSDWCGLGYGPLLAKSLGLAFDATHFVVHGHCPTLWAAEGGRRLISQERQLGWVFMERRSVELADTLTCGSAHLLQWMRDAGYALPARAFVWPDPFPAPGVRPATGTVPLARCDAALEEVVFFARLEPRRGLELFIDAIDRLARQGRAPARITFLGRTTRDFEGLGRIESASRSWPMEVRTISDCDTEEALSYLSQPGRLAVLPALRESASLAVIECLEAGIPFLATASGGTPELVACEDQALALVAPDHIALGERIAELAGAPLRAVRARWDSERVLEVWSRWHAGRAPFEAAAERFAQRSRAADAGTPLVTVCIVHHERPALVRMAVDSVFEQDYPALEAVLVDDGSESAEALAVLTALEGEFAERGWRVLREENRHAGAARNTAAAAARGEWLLFLDDDNLLFPDAVSRLVRAARFSGAAAVPAASVPFFGDGDPRTETGSHRAPIRFLGAARFWNRIRNVAGDTCALVHRDAYEATGGFPEERGIWLQDMCLFNRLIRTGRRVEPMPDPVYYYRLRKPGPMDRDRPTEAARARLLAPCIEGLPAEERAFAAYCAAVSNELGTSWNEMAVHERELEAFLKELDVSWRKAIREVETLLNKVVDKLTRSMTALMEAKRFKAAEGLASEVVARFPGRVEGHLRLAELAMRRRDWEAACARWARVREGFPERVAGFSQGVVALREAGRLEEAEALAGEAAARFPERVEGHLRLAELAMRRRDWEAACARWARVREGFPERVAGFSQGVVALREAGRLEEAEALAGEAAARFPGQARADTRR